MLSFSIVLAQPAAMALLLPWIGFWLWLAVLQRRSLREAHAKIGDRFRSGVTRHSGRSLGLHLAAILMLGLVAILAAAGPGPDKDRSRSLGPGRVLFLLDASASMYATDVASLEEVADRPSSRFDHARRLGVELVEGLDGFEFAVASFSGVATVHLPLTRDRELASNALSLLENHSYYRNTGSSFEQGLGTVFHFFQESEAPLQVVLLSDGELPFEESYDEPLEALAEAGIRVHTVAIGSTTGQTRVIYDFQDVVAKAAKKRVLREYTTRRVDRDLRRISERTGGSFGVLSAETAEVLLSAVLDGLADSRDDPGAETARQPGAPSVTSSWTLVPLLLTLLGFLTHAAFLSRRPSVSFAFDLERVGDWPAGARAGARIARSMLVLLAGLVTLSCAGSAERRAHRANEQGIAQDALGLHAAARRHYERSVSYGVRPEVPTHNLGRSLTLAGDFSEAHELFQKALEVDPGLAEARFNDGVALYRWGVEERDPRDCQLARTRELWLAAEKRFAGAATRKDSEEDLVIRALSNRGFVSSEIAALDRLIAEPPAHCGKPPPTARGGGGGGGGEDPSEAGGQPPPGGQDPPPPAGGSPPPEPPPGSGAAGGAPPPGSGPLSAQELEQIGRELERMAAQIREEGKFYRRTLPEQFRKEDWSDPDEEIWW